MHIEDHMEDMMNERRYCDYAPTQFDCRGLGLQEQQDWIVGPVIRTRDSGLLELSNWDAAYKMIDEASSDSGGTVEIHRFNHWGPGWFEIILIDPSDHGALKVAAEILCALADYPVLDEEDHSSREYEASFENIENAARCLIVENPPEGWAGLAYNWLEANADHMGWREDPENYSVREDDMRSCLEDLGLLDPDA